MLYWPGKKNAEHSLEEELFNGGAITEVCISTAYISDDGIAIIERLKAHYQLPKDKIEVILSNEFSSQSPAEKLERLCRCSRVSVLQDRLLHAKAYWLQGPTSKLIMGSSNLTRGGFDRNIELDEIMLLDEQTESEVRSFFAYCRTRSLPADKEIIAYYKSIEPDLARLQENQRKARKLLQGYRKSDDPFSEQAYDLSSAYFKYEDYECLFPRNQREKRNPDLQARRKKLQEKMLLIHERVYPQVKKLGIDCHKSKQHITSLIHPEPYNLWKVSWMGVRYGKEPWELDLLNAGTEDRDEVLGFQKHGCLQFCIGPEAFEINLFLAVRHQAVDREYMHEKIKMLSPQIISEVAKIKGQHMCWCIQDDASCYWPPSFDFDTEKPEDFITYFKKYDRDGCESFLYLGYEPDDPQIQTLESISKLIVEKMTLLSPLYNAMVYRISKEHRV